MEAKIVVPSMGESIVEATVVRWYKKVGEPVTTGEPLLELETNKANLDIGAEQTGVLAAIEKQEGQDVKVGETLGSIDTEGKAQAAAPAAPAQAKPAPEPEKATPAAPQESAHSPDGGGNATPVAQRMAAEKQLDLARVKGSGAGGKVTREDVEKYLAEAGNAPAEEAKSAPAPAPAARPAQGEPKEPEKKEAPAQTSPLAGMGGGARQEERIRMSRRRKTIASRLVETQNSAAMLTTFNDVDMSAVMELRKARKEAFKEKHGVSLGIVSFFVKASILALKEFPRLNAEVQGEEMVLKHYYDIGIAIGDEEGLVVPVLQEADRMSFVEIERGIQGFARKVKDHKLSLQDVMGGTFTITNGGVFGSLLSTPILNGPEVGILGLHRIEDRPVVVNGGVTVRPMMYLALSYDHRIVDGREAVQFLARVKQAIEDPQVLLLGM
jgi:2-oxoglutarate dehydrogenase E2 component (dihydrolipoamide succinyltransferase)